MYIKTRYTYIKANSTVHLSIITHINAILTTCIEETSTDILYQLRVNV